ncbi:MAG TPA: acetylglutamate kinase [Planctomycetota bacterium]|nr:acetylglutamate kinase [Planctomycetota bacterium]
MNPEHLNILRQALPFINRFKNKTFVVKIGGEIADSEETLHSFCEEVALLSQVGIHVVMVHGGGKQATQLSKQLGIEPQMVQGRRITDEQTLDVVMMVFAGTINTEIIAALRQYGAEPVGISGVDGGIINAVKRPPQKIRNDKTGLEEVVDFGHVGDIQSIDPKLLETLLAADFVPVMASLGGDDAGNILNINADTVASEIASALKAEKLILLTDVDGILRDDKTLISRVTPQEIDELIKSGVIRGGMVPKAMSAVDALKDGVQSVHIISGKKASSLLAEVFTETGSGTMIHRNAPPVKARGRKKAATVSTAPAAPLAPAKATDDKPAPAPESTPTR